MLPKVLSHQNVDRSQPFPFTIGAKISVKLTTKEQNNPLVGNSHAKTSNEPH